MNENRKQNIRRNKIQYVLPNYFVQDCRSHIFILSRPNCIFHIFILSRPNCICLSGIRLSDIRQSGIRLSGIRLSGIRLSGIHLSGIRLSGIRLSGIRLSCIRLSGIRLPGIRYPSILPCLPASKKYTSGNFKRSDTTLQRFCVIRDKITRLFLCVNIMV